MNKMKRIKINYFNHSECSFSIEENNVNKDVDKLIEQVALGKVKYSTLDDVECGDYLYTEEDWMEKMIGWYGRRLIDSIFDGYRSYLTLDYMSEEDIEDRHIIRYIMLKDNFKYWERDEE